MVVFQIYKTKSDLKWNFKWVVMLKLSLDTQKMSYFRSYFRIEKLFFQNILDLKVSTADLIFPSEIHFFLIASGFITSKQ